jgi:ArsR family transcriptional regulator
VNRAIEAYKAIGEETRLRILRLLRLAPGELCVCELVDVVEKPQYTVSKALTALRKAELIAERREGKLMMYRLVHCPFNEILLQSLDTLPAEDPRFAADEQRLRERLALRRNGKCVITYRH